MTPILRELVITTLIPKCYFWHISLLPLFVSLVFLFATSIDISKLISTLTNVLCSSFIDSHRFANSVLSLSSCARDDFKRFWLLFNSSFILHKLATSTCFVAYSSAKARLTLSSTAERRDACQTIMWASLQNLQLNASTYVCVKYPKVIFTLRCSDVIVPELLSSFLIGWLPPCG